MDSTILSILENIGLTGGEAKVYCALNKLGTSTITSILNESGISTSKVYIILEKLIKKGLVSLTIENAVKHFTPADPNSLLDFLAEEKKRIETNEVEVTKIIPMLKNEFNSKSKKPIMEVIKGKHGFKVTVEGMINDAKDGAPLTCLVANRISFSMQSLWKELSQLTDKKKIPQISTYEYSTWFDKDPKIHKRSERKYLFPTVMNEKYKDLPYILNLGDSTLIADIDGTQVVSYVLRNKLLSDAFKKLLAIIREQAEVPQNAKEWIDNKKDNKKESKKDNKEYNKEYNK